MNQPQIMESIRAKRGAVTTNFASIEFFIAEFITVHYFGSVHQKFMAEVLEDEYFSFGLLMKIFDKVLSEYPNEYASFPFQKLRRLQRLRNVIVHARLQSPVQLDPQTETIDSIEGVYFRHAGEDHAVEDIFNEYEKLRAVVQPAVVALPGIQENVGVVSLKSE